MEENVTGRRWWQHDEPEQIAGEVWAVARALEKDQKSRTLGQLDFLNLYEGRKLSELNAGAYQTQAEFLDLVLPLCRSLCESVQADIAGRQKPKPEFMTSGADWQTRRRAKQLDKFVLAMLSQPQGQYVDVWELMGDAFLDACVWGLGAVKVYADQVEQKVAVERHFYHELFVDPQEARYGDPQNLFHVYTMDREKAKATFNAKREEDGGTAEQHARYVALENATATDSEVYGTTRRVAHQIVIVEAWRLPLSPTEPGMHVFCHENTLLHAEDWEQDTFGFVFMKWAPHRMGWGAAGLIEETQSTQEELNEVAARLQEAYRLRSSRRTYYRPGSVDEDDMQSNETEVMVPVQDGQDYPKSDAIPPVSNAELEYPNTLIAWGYQFSGVSQMSATSQKQPGVDSGVAMRTLRDMGTARFAVKAKMFENSFVALGKEFARCAARIPNYSVRLPGKNAFEELKASAALLEENQYEVRVAPASNLPNDPAGRLAMVQEMYTSGVIKIDTFRRLLDWTDLDKELSRDSAEFEFIEDLLDRYRDATPEEATAKDFFEMPEGFIFGKEAAMTQIGAAYFEAKRQGAPEENLDLLRRYITELEAQILKAQQAQAALQNPQPQASGAPAASPPPAAAGAPALPPAATPRAAA